MTTTAESSRPGTTFFAPDVRLMGLDVLRDGPEMGNGLESEHSHIVSVEVTRVNTGSSQYSIVLNNWDDPLPEQRTGETHSNRPPYKYNDLDPFEFGQRLRIDMRYWPDQPREAGGDVHALHRWVPMIAGPITDMRFSFSSGEGARLSLIGEDDLYPLKNKATSNTPYRNKNEQEIINDVLGLANYPLPLQDPVTSWPSFFTSSTGRLTLQLDEGQNYLEFLQQIAKRYDCEIFVEFDDLEGEQPSVQLHFEPARSRLPADADLPNCIVLRYRDNLIEFSPTFKVFDQYTDVKVQGRHRNRRRAEQVSSNSIEAGILNEELHLYNEQSDPQLTAGPEVRSHYFGKTFGENIHQLPRQTNMDQERIQEMAEAVFRGKAREFMTVVGTTVGIPTLRPGMYILIQDMQPPFDGFYYVVKTVVRYSSSGFTTQFTARRPGMPLPPFSNADEE